MIQVATEAGLLAEGATGDVLSRYREATGDVPNLSFLDWLFIFNVLSPDAVQELSDAFERTAFECRDCGHRFSGQDLDPDDEGLGCIACGSANLIRIDANQGQDMRPPVSASYDAGAMESRDSAHAVPAAPNANANANGGNGAAVGTRPARRSGKVQGRTTGRIPPRPRSGGNAAETLPDPDYGEPEYEEFEAGLKPGTRLGRCVIDSYVARGGMGMVYKGKHLDLGRAVAVKVLLTDYTSNKTLAERFRMEARAVAQIEHPNIVQVYDYGEAGGHSYFVMQWIDGESLAQRMTRLGKVPPDQVLDIGSQVCHALQAAHDAGIIHRDIKPDNILVMPDGLVKLADFGLSKNQASDTRLSQSGTYVGTPAYLAPEQLGKNVTPLADLYALACSLYHALTGRLPFGGDDAATVLQKHLTAPFPTARRLNPDVPEEMDLLLQKMAAKNPRHRPPSALDTADQMIGILNDLGNGAGGRIAGGDSRRRPGSGSPEDNARSRRVTARIPTGPTGTIMGGTGNPPVTSVRPKTRPLRTGSAEPPNENVAAAGVTAETRPLPDPVGPAGHHDTPNVPVTSEPKAPANFPFRQARQDATREKLRATNDLFGESGRRPENKPASRRLDRLRRSAQPPEVTRSELQGVLENQQRRMKSIRWVVGGIVGVLGIALVLIVVFLLTSSDPRKTALDLRLRVQGIADRALVSGELNELRPARIEMQQFRETNPGISQTEFDELDRQIDVAFASRGSGAESEAAMRRLLEWVNATPDARQARLNQDLLRRYGDSLPPDAFLRLDPLIGALQQMIRRDLDLAEMRRLVGSARAVRTADEAVEWLADLRAFSKEHAELVDAEFRAELDRLDGLIVESVNARIARADALTDLSTAGGMLTELRLWREANPDLLVGPVATRFAEAMLRIERKSQAWLTATDLISRARAVTTREAATAVLREMDTLQQSFPTLTARFADVRKRLDELATVTTNMKLTPAVPDGPFVFRESDERSYLVELTSLTLVGFDVKYDKGDTRILAALIDNADDELIGASIVGLDNDGTPHSYVIRTLHPGKYRLHLYMATAGAATLNAVSVTMYQFPGNGEVSATPEGALELSMGGSHGPAALAESRWYRFKLATDGWVRLQADYNEKYDVDVELFRATPGKRLPGTFIERAVSTKSPELIVRWLPAGTYYARAHIAEFIDMLTNFQQGGSTLKISLSQPVPGLAEKPQRPRRLDTRFDGGLVSGGEWALQPGDYRIAREIEVDADSYLVIRAGTRLRFAPGVGITCRGKLLVEGEPGKAVSFAAAETNDPWSNVLVEGPASAAQLSYAHFSGGSGRRYRFTKDGSKPDPSATGTKGGGLWLLRAGGLALLDNCTFSANRALPDGEDSGGLGGGLHIEACSASVIGCSFLNNRAHLGGGGFGSDRAAVYARGCRFEGNTAHSGGGFIAFVGNYATLDQCSFTDNVAEAYGGGAMTREESSTTLLRCEFTRNRAQIGAGAFSYESKITTLDGCTFTGNRATGDGGGAASVRTRDFVIVRGTFNANEAAGDAGGVYLLDSPLKISESRFIGNKSKLGGAILGRYRRDSIGAATESDLRSGNSFTDNGPRDVIVETVE
ncbi:MAG: protein kinase [Planctomycetota bacterium]